MRSTFANLETAKRGMMTHQLALSTTGHNVANASTEGYTRQRINFQTTTPWPAIGLNRPQIPGQLGTGVEAGTVDRVRDFYLDAQFRNKVPSFGYWNNRATALARVEDIVNEPTDAGLNKVLDTFWESIQDVTTRPNDLSARKVMIERAKSVKETFNFMATQTETARQETKLEVDIYIQDINTVLKNLNTLNREIMELEVNGYKPNDLYDKRDVLVDQISEIIQIDVTRNPAPKHNPSAEGTYNIDFIRADGTKVNILNGTTLEAATFGMNAMQTKEMKLLLDANGQLVPTEVDAYDYFTSLTITQNIPPAAQPTTTDVNLGELNQKGQLFGAIEAYGYVDTKPVANVVPNAGDIKGIYRDHLKKLDEMAYNFAKEFNAIHKKGADLNGNVAANGDQIQDFFKDFADPKDEFGAAKAFAVALTDPKDIAASSDGSEGNNDNAKLLVDFIKNGNVGVAANGNPTGYHIKGEIEDIVSSLGAEAEDANRMKGNTLALTNSADNNRISVTGVSLDEEMVDLVRFQHAYNGSARMITVVDECLDKIINGMGVVGR